MPKILVLNYINIITYLINAIIHSHTITIPVLAPKQSKVIRSFCCVEGNLDIFYFKTVTLYLEVT